MLLSVALALLRGAGHLGVPAVPRRPSSAARCGALNGLAFQLVAEPRFEGQRRWKRMRIERTAHNPLARRRAARSRDAKRNCARS